MTLLLTICAALLLMYAALHDLAVRTVPNWVSGLLLLLGIALRAFEHDLLLALGVAVILFLFLFLVWTAGLMGGGDVKLWAASALLIPATWRMELMFMANIMLSGGILAIFYLFLSFVIPKPAASTAGSFPRRFLRTELWRVERRASLPYACAIAGGTLAVLLPQTFQS